MWLSDCQKAEVSSLCMFFSLALLHSDCAVVINSPHCVLWEKIMWGMLRILDFYSAASISFSDAKQMKGGAEKKHNLKVNKYWLYFYFLSIWVKKKKKKKQLWVMKLIDKSHNDTFLRYFQWGCQGHYFLFRKVCSFLELNKSKKFTLRHG